MSSGNQRRSPLRIARRLMQLNPLRLSSLQMAHVGWSSSVARHVAMPISAPPARPTPSCCGALHGVSAAWPAATSCSAVGFESVKTSHILSAMWCISTRPERRRSAEPTPIGRVDPSGFSRPTSTDSPRKASEDSWKAPALIFVTMLNSVFLYAAPPW